MNADYLHERLKQAHTQLTLVIELTDGALVLLKESMVKRVDHRELTALIVTAGNLAIGAQLSLEQADGCLR